MTVSNIRSGLIDLTTRVKAYLVANSVNAEVHLGWQARHRILTQGPGGANRIVFTPGDDNGKGGRIVATQQPGPRYVGGTTQATATDSVRALRDWERFVIVSVWGRDPTATGDEEARENAHLEVTEDLIEWTVRAVHACGLANATFGDVMWTPPEERAYGLEARIGLTFRHPLFDVPADVVRPKPAIAKDLTP
jgi:hypothetical protein